MKSRYVVQSFILIVCSVIEILLGYFALDGFLTDAWAMKNPVFNDIGVFICYALFAIGLIGIVYSIILLVATRYNEFDKLEIKEK